ncbi:putative Integral membrane protein [Seiridium unicorne]|uniref:Integral membrane protein n=1 Tax=Seiridium unicorne TaxID=138068 RepID=A0ABR2UQQ4_9PEZI
MSSATEIAAYESQIYDSSIAVWIPTGLAALFLAFRLYVRRSRLGTWLWDDYWLALAYVCLLIGAILVSVSFVSDISVNDGKRHFFFYQQLSSSILALATTWSKCAFVMTLWRLTNRIDARIFLIFLVVSSHLLVIVSILGIYVPACGDPKMPLRPYYSGPCLNESAIRTLFTTPIVYGGIMDLLLSLFPWFIVRKLQLEKQERLGVAVAMGLGALTGIIVILRSALQYKRLVGRFDSLVFLQIFNTLEPSITVILQTIPIFRVLFMEAKNSRIKYNVYNAQSQLRSPTSDIELVRNNGLNKRVLSSVLPGGYTELGIVHLTVGPGGRIVEVKKDMFSDDNARGYGKLQSDRARVSSVQRMDE